VLSGRSKMGKGPEDRSSGPSFDQYSGLGRREQSPRSWNGIAGCSATRRPSWGESAPN